MRRWSKLKKYVEDFFVSDLGMQIHCTVYTQGKKKCPRHWLVLDKVIIWDFPKNFIGVGGINDICAVGGCISQLLDHYYSVRKEDLLKTKFDDDLWGLTVLLKAADRRLGKKRLLAAFADASPESAVSQILLKRFS